MRRMFVLGAVVATAAAYHQSFVNEEDVIRLVNTNQANTWVAGPNPRFENYTMDQVIAMMGTFVDKDAPQDGANDLLYFDVINSLPKEFDGREKWGRCIHPILNQMKCGSCWAFGATEALSDRFCIAGKDVVLSPQNLVSCDPTDHGCQGGTLRNAWQYMASSGVVTAECEPYTAGQGIAGPCLKSCQNGKRPVIYRARNSYSVVSFFDNDQKKVKKIKAEIFKNGPIEAGYTVFQDFLSYKGGVYQHVTGGAVGGHAIKVVGWGKDSGVPYWIMANSWGAEWGEGGFFRMAIGQNGYEIESNVYAGIPDLRTGAR